MADEPLPSLSLELVTPPPTPNDALDIESLWLDPALGDGLTDTSWHSIPADKPKDFFRVHPDRDYRRRTEIYAHKVEGQIETAYYIWGRRCGDGWRKPALRSRDLHLSRRLTAAVADHVSARWRKGQHGLDQRPGRGADRDRQVGAPGLEQGARI